MNFNEYKPSEGWMEFNRKKANEVTITLPEAIGFAIVFIAIPFIASIAQFLK